MDSLKHVELVPHDPSWVERARMEAERVGRILGVLLIRTEHIGSTAIPGIQAKPTLDLMPLVTTIEPVDQLQTQFESAGYRWYGEIDLPRRRYANRDDPETGLRIVNVHIYPHDDPEAVRHLAFRDYLRAHPDLASAYEVVKVRCAAMRPRDVIEYNDCKNDWIKATERDALAWWIASSQK